MDVKTNPNQTGISPQPANSTPPLHKFLAFATIILLLDQLLKVWAKFNFEPNEKVNLLGDWLKLHFIENKGAAFGWNLADFFQSASTFQAQFFQVLLSIIAVSLIFIVLLKTRKAGSLLPWWVACVLGGAIGNLIDRIFYGYWFEPRNDYEGGIFAGRVVDLIHIDLWQGRLPAWFPFVGNKPFALFPVFNLADLAILIGILGVTVMMVRFFVFQPENKKTPPPADEGADNQN